MGKIVEKYKDTVWSEMNKDVEIIYKWLKWAVGIWDGWMGNEYKENSNRGSEPVEKSRVRSGNKVRGFRFYLRFLVGWATPECQQQNYRYAYSWPPMQIINMHITRITTLVI